MKKKIHQIPTMANLTKFTYSSSHLSLLFFFLFISSIQSQQPILSTDPSFYYNLCAPSRCNNLTLPYPFALPNSCYPSNYKPICPTNQSLLLTSRNSTDTIRVLSLNYSDPTTANVLIASDSLFTCGAQVSRPDYRLDATIFSLSSNYTPGTHLNCTAPIPSDSIRGLQNASCLGCNGQDPNNICYYAPGFVSYPTTCEKFYIFTPDGAFNASGVTDLRAFLQSGYQLRYAKPVECRGCEISGGRCGSQPISGSFVCFCTSSVHRMNCSDGIQVDLSTWVNGPGGGGSGLSKATVAALAIGIGGLLAAAVIFLIWRSKQSLTKSIIFWKRSNRGQLLVEESLKSFGSLAPKRYSYSDIKKITNSFKDIVGKGGYGLVYKGKLLDGRLVAVKLLNKAKGDGEEFINEVGSITRTSHVNIVSLLGFCYEGSKRALIYEFMPNGSLEKFIYDPNPLEAQSQLGWEMLYQIAIGVARGLEYLHRGCNTRILHFDIKPHNILLDHDFTPKISDFGLAKLCLNKESVISMLDARGTAGYIAPEVFNRNFGGVSNKSDVYSYGMMVLEIVGRRKNINVQVDNTSEIYFPQWIYKRVSLDADLELYGITSQEETKIAKKMILVALWCIQTNPIDRPSMSKVVEMFEGRNELLQIPPTPYLCCSPRSRVGSSNT